MNKIVISGYYGLGNLGDEAVLAGIIKSLRSRQNDLQIVVLSYRPEVTAARYQVSSIYRYDLLNILKIINSCDLFISGGGSLLQDETSFRSIPYYLGLVFLAWLLGKKTVFYAQGIGPISGNIARKMVSWMGKRTDLITVRDNCSRMLLTEMGFTVDDIKETVDPAFALAPCKYDGNLKKSTDLRRVEFTKYKLKYNSNDIENVIDELNQINNAKSLIAVCVRPWYDNDYLQPLASALDELARETDCTMVAVPLNYNQDYSLSLKLCELMSTEIKVLGRHDLNPLTMIDIFSRFDVVVGVRLHSLIFAAINRVPFLGISYDPKIDGFISNLGLEPPVPIADCSQQLIQQRWKSLWDNREQITMYLDEKVNQYKKEAEKQAEVVLDLLS